MRSGGLQAAAWPGQKFDKASSVMPKKTGTSIHRFMGTSLEKSENATYRQGSWQHESLFVYAGGAENMLRLYQKLAPPAFYFLRGL